MKTTTAVIAGLVSIYAIGPFAAHADQLRTALDRAVTVRADATPLPGTWQGSMEGRTHNPFGPNPGTSSEVNNTAWRIGGMGG